MPRWATPSTPESEDETGMGEDGTRLSRDEHRRLHFYMVLTRKLEERMGKLFRQNRIVGGLYRSTGQEACAVGVGFACQPRDWIAPLIRDLGWSLVRGWDPYDVLAQFTARGDAPTLSRDGNLHFGSLAMRQIAPISHLGALVPVMAGIAMAARMRGEDTVAVTAVGDGATSTGAFHEGMNLIAVRGLPCVVVGQDNRYAYSTPIAAQMACRSLEERALAYGMKVMSADGNDIEDVVVTAREAMAHARDGRGPVFLVLHTFRMCGHAEHDDARYVPPEEMSHWKALDPIDRHRGRVMDLGLLSRAEVTEIQADADAAIDEAVERVLAAADADPALVGRWVYAEPGDPRVESPAWKIRGQEAGS